MSLYYDSGVLVKLYVREARSDVVARFLAGRGEAVTVNSLHELEMRNALRLKRFRDEIDDGQLAASMTMLETDLATGRLMRGRIDWPIRLGGSGAPVGGCNRWGRSADH